MIKKILSVLALSSVAVMGLSSVSASAMMTTGSEAVSGKIVNDSLIQSSLKIVNSKNGLALRDKNCKKIASVSNKAHLVARSTGANNEFANAPKIKTCRINGKNVKVILAQELAGSIGGNTGYVQSAYLIPTYTTKALSMTTGGNYYAKANANIRDSNCKVVETVKADSDFSNLKINSSIAKGTGVGGKSVACKFGNKYYQMVQIGMGYVSPTMVKVVTPL